MTGGSRPGAAVGIGCAAALPPNLSVDYRLLLCTIIRRVFIYLKGLYAGV